MYLRYCVICGWRDKLKLKLSAILHIWRSKRAAALHMNCD